MFPLYTKTFGGKIWKNLHSVSPDNNFGKKFKMASLQISRQKVFKHNLVRKLSENNLTASPSLNYDKFSGKIFGQFSANGFYFSCTRLCQENHFARSTNMAENTEFV